jgi:hypothetical protein
VSARYKIPVNITTSGEPVSTAEFQVIKRDADGFYWIYTETGWQLLVGITTESIFLTSDVTMTNANEFYDGPQIALIEGIWQIVGNVTVASPDNTAMRVTVKLFDGGNETILGAGEALFLSLYLE